MLRLGQVYEKFLVNHFKRCIIADPSSIADSSGNG
jgi:hypothetical protein